MAKAKKQERQLGNNDNSKQTFPRLLPKPQESNTDMVVDKDIQLSLKYVSESYMW